MSLENVIARALADEAFKRELIGNPRAILEKELGPMLPEGIEIYVHEQTATQWHIELPMDPEQGDPQMQELIARAREDEAFKQRLLDSPQATLEEALGIEVPEGVEIHVHEQTPTQVHLMLPANPEV